MERALGKEQENIFNDTFCHITHVNCYSLTMEKYISLEYWIFQNFETWPRRPSQDPRERVLTDLQTLLLDYEITPARW